MSGYCVGATTKAVRTHCGAVLADITSGPNRSACLNLGRKTLQTIPNEVLRSIDEGRLFVVTDLFSTIRRVIITIP